MPEQFIKLDKLVYRPGEKIIITGEGFTDSTKVSFVAENSAASTPTPTPTPGPVATQNPPSFAAIPTIATNRMAIAQPAATSTTRLAAGRGPEANAWQIAGNKTDYQANAVDDFVKALQATGGYYDHFTDIWIENIALKTSRTWADGGTKWTTAIAAPVGADVGFYNPVPVDGDFYSYSNGTLYFGAHSQIGAYGKNGTANKASFTINAGSGWKRIIRQGGVGAELSSGVAYSNLLQHTTDSAVDANAATLGLTRVTNNSLFTLSKAQILCYKENGDYFFPLSGHSPKNQAFAIAARKLSAALQGKVAVAVGAIGDSITAGALPFGTAAFISQLETKTGVPFINGGRGGNSFRANSASAQPGSRADYVSNMRPWVQAGIVKEVLIAYGANDVNFAGSIASQFGDANAQQTIDRTTAELGLLVADILADGLTKSNILVSGLLTKGGESTRYPMDTAIETWCTANIVQYVQNWQIMSALSQAQRDAFYSIATDNIHPKDATAGAYIADSILGINAVPTVTYTSLTSGTINPGQTVTITGTGFVSGTQPIWTGGNTPVFTFVNATTITFPAPAVGSYTVGSLALTVTAAAVPFLVTAYSPDIVAVGDTMVVTHTGPRPTALTLSIAFGGFAAITVTPINSTSFSIVIPAQSVGNFKMYRWSGDAGVTNTSPVDGGTVSVVARVNYSLAATIPAYTVRGPFNYALGFEFTASQGGFVTAIKVYHDAATANIARTVRVWNSGVTLLETLTIPATATAGWQTVNLVTPVRLNYGDKVTIALDGSQKWVQNDDLVSVIGTPTIGSVIGVADANAATNKPTSVTSSWLGVDFVYSTP